MDRRSSPLSVKVAGRRIAVARVVVHPAMRPEPAVLCLPHGRRRTENLIRESAAHFVFIRHAQLSVNDLGFGKLGQGDPATYRKLAGLVLCTIGRMDKV